MAKHWSGLTLADFVRANPDWEVDFPEATVEFVGQEVTLSAPDQEEVTENEVALFKRALPEWEARLGDVAKRTEKLLQNFLPGRKVSPEEIAIFDVAINSEEEPIGIAFMFNVTGDYRDPNYRLDEFDQESFVEFSYEIEDGEIDWESPSPGVSNDLD